MPREIITIQIGQCGNQSKHSTTQSEPSFGSSFARNMASVPPESSSNTLPTTKSRIERMSSSTRQTMTTTFPGPSW